MIKINRSEQKRMRDEVMDILVNRLPPLSRMPIPNSIRSERWFEQSGIEKQLRKYALPCFRMSTFNGKTPPAFKAWLMDEEAGRFENNPIVIGSTSGNWGMSAGLIAPLFSVQKFCAVIDMKTPEGKQNQLRASGADIMYAPAGVVPTDYVYQLIQDSQYHLIDQYIHEGSVQGHQWTMDHIARELARLNETPSLFGAVAGTCSTLMAADRYLKKTAFPAMKIFGVASMSKEEKVPGSRSPEMLADLKRIGGFPYEEVLDFPLVANVRKQEAYALTAAFVQRHFISAGPTAGLLEAGSYNLLREHWETHGDFKALANPAGDVVMVSFFMDMHLAYLDEPDFLAAFRT